MLQLRELGPDDAEFLGEMLYAALFWTPLKERLPIELVLAHPEISIFHEGWGRPGDTGLVAEIDGVPVGAAWYRLFTEESTARDTSTSGRPSSRSRSSTAGAARGSGARCWRRWPTAREPTASSRSRSASTPTTRRDGCTPASATPSTSRATSLGRMLLTL